MTLELTWPSVALLRLAPVGHLDPQVFGLRWLEPVRDWRADAEARLEVVDAERLALLGGTIAALAPGEPSDRRKVLLGALGRIRGVLVGYPCAVRIT